MDDGPNTGRQRLFARINRFPAGRVITLGAAGLFALALFGSFNAPRPQPMDQQSWEIFTDRAALGLDDGAILGVWRSMDPSARIVGGARQCGIRRYAVWPDGLRKFARGEASGGWTFGPATTAESPPLLTAPSEFCDLPQRVLTRIGPEIADALNDRDNPRFAETRELRGGWVMTMHGVVDLEATEAWTWLRVDQTPERVAVNP